MTKKELIERTKKLSAKQVRIALGYIIREEDEGNTCHMHDVYYILRLAKGKKDNETLSD